jgi:large subunit ribosomal protein L4
VAGTKKKPYRQKGTGMARAGSFQSPIWVGGGVVFPPRPRDFDKKVNKSARRLALRKAISERLKAGDVTVLSELQVNTPKTKDFLAWLKRLELGDGSVLLVVSGNDRNLLLSSRNVAGVELTTGDMVSVTQVLRYDKLVFTREAFDKLGQRLGE